MLLFSLHTSNLNDFVDQVCKGFSETPDLPNKTTSVSFFNKMKYICIELWFYSIMTNK